jgi:carboxymethylenebutenolidase
MDHENVTAQWIERDGLRWAYLVLPSHRRATAAVLVLHEAFGLNAAIQAVCLRLASTDYAVLAPDLYWRGPDRVAGYDERAKAIAMLKTLPDEQVIADAALAIDRLREITAGVPIGVVGYRIGGRYALLVAEHDSRVRATIGYYGAGIDGGTISPLWTLNALEGAKNLRAPALLIFVGDDPTIPGDEVARIEQRLRELGVRHELVRYPGIRPGFTFPDRATYSPGEAGDAWRRTLDFFDTHLRRRGETA